MTINTKLLLHMDGTGSTYVDSSDSGHSVSAIDNPLQQDTIAVFDKAADFNGTSQYLEVAPSSDWNFGSGDFTIECWVRFKSINAGGAHTLVSYWKHDTTDRSWMLAYFDTERRFDFAISANGVSNAVRLNSSSAVTLNQWYHVAAVRSGATVYLFINGTLVDSDVAQNPYVVSGVPVKVGAYDVGTSFLGSNAYIDEVRISDTARWTSNFSVPTEPYLPAEQQQSGGSPLLCWEATGRYLNGRVFQQTGPNKFPKDFKWPNGVMDKVVIEDGEQII